MPTVTKLVGFVLLMIATGSFLASGLEFTALIPAVFGVPILLAGVIAERHEDKRMHAIHASLVVALLGFAALTPTALGLGAMGDASDMAKIEALLSAVVLLAYIAFGVRSFIAARKARRDSR